MISTVESGEPQSAVDVTHTAQRAETGCDCNDTGQHSDSVVSSFSKFESGVCTTPPLCVHRGFLPQPKHTEVGGIAFKLPLSETVCLSIFTI